MIKPLGRKEYDADMMLLIKHRRGMNPEDLIHDLYDALRSSPAYSRKVSRKTRCVTINYAGDFHLDLVPHRFEKGGLFSRDKFSVINRHTNKYERSDGLGFASWLREKNTIVPQNMLLKTIQLLKYLRDHKQTFAAKSIVITTLVGQQISNYESESDFRDIPTSLKTTIERLDSFLRKHKNMPLIKNPAMTDENFNRHWDQTSYSQFRKMISKYRAWIDEAIEEKSRKKSIELWQRIFGSDFS